MNGIDASWLVGHCGSSDLGRSYRVLTWQFASSEDKPRVTELLSTSTDLIHALYNTLRVMAEENAAVDQTESFSLHAKPLAMHTDKTCDTFDKSRKRLARFNQREQHRLKQLLIQAHSLHAIEPTENETTMQYVIND